MKKKLFFVPLCCFCILLLNSCSEQGAGIEYDGSIYGVVTDFATGNPVPNANVQLRPGGVTTLTGSDGRYEFLDVEDGAYSVVVSKAEYTDLIDDYVIVVKDGRRMRRDVQIEKIPTYIRFTDMKGNDIRVLDFGADASTDLMSFNIYNNGTTTISCKVTYACQWISFVSSVPNLLKPGQNAMVTIQIDRAKLSAGQNETYLYIASNNGNNMLKITAMGQFVLPNVLTLPVTNKDGKITPWCDTFHAEVTSIGNPAYHKRGFCYSSTNQIPTINDNCIEIAGIGLGEYSYTCYNLGWQTIIYYVRAWLMYDSDNKIQYGNVVSFKFNDV